MASSPDLLTDEYGFEWDEVCESDFRRFSVSPHSNLPILFKHDSDHKVDISMKSLSAQQEEYNNAVRSLLYTAGQQNWDGEGANPVTEHTVETALEVVKELPFNIESPEIFADSEGDIEFDWYLDNGTMFSINTGKMGEIAISGLYDTETRLTGMQWGKGEEEIYLLIRCGLEWLSMMQRR